MTHMNNWQHTSICEPWLGTSCLWVVIACCPAVLPVGVAAAHQCSPRLQGPPFSLRGLSCFTSLLFRLLMVLFKPACVLPDLHPAPSDRTTAAGAIRASLSALMASASSVCAPPWRPSAGSGALRPGGRIASHRPSDPRSRRPVAYMASSLWRWHSPITHHLPPPPFLSPPLPSLPSVCRPRVCAVWRCGPAVAGGGPAPGDGPRLPGLRLKHYGLHDGHAREVSEGCVRLVVW